MITVSIPTDLEHELKFHGKVNILVNKEVQLGILLKSSVEVILSDFYHSRDKNVFF